MATTGYDLGVDLGSSFVAAAVLRGGRTEILPIGERSDLMPATVGWSGGLLVAEAAERLALTHPDDVVSGLIARLGDPTPVRLGGSGHQVELLISQLLVPVIGRARSRYGGPPTAVVLTHPAGWGPYRREAMVDVARRVGLSSVTLVSDPVAAAFSHHARQRMREGQLVAVYDFGGHAFEATLLRRTLDGFQVVGKPDGFVDLGGVNLDERVFEFVRDRAGQAMDHLDPQTTAGRAGLVALRRDCAMAKERLSRDAATPVFVRVPSGSLRVDITREEFEDLVRRPVDATVETFAEVLEGAGIDKRQLSATLLVGGSSQIPLVSRLMFEQLGIRPVPAGHPKFAIPIGATLAASQPPATADDDAEGRTEVVTIKTLKRQARKRPSPVVWALLAVLAVLLVVVGVVVVRAVVAG